jgi:hypothetical protein
VNICCRNNDDVTEYLVKWKELGYDEATWEVEEDISAFQAEIDKYEEIMSRQSMKKRKGSALDQKDLKRRRRDFKPFKKTPKFLVGGIDYYRMSYCYFVSSCLLRSDISLNSFYLQRMVNWFSHSLTSKCSSVNDFKSLITH